MYSARPGGPKLYDLLNMMSLEPYGIMAWFVVDKEEEIFELDEVRDEDKVMQALWARWIMLNRSEYDLLCYRAMLLKSILGIASLKTTSKVPSASSMITGA